MSKNIIIGTAGHIDHGKTTLIKALTGSDTDRLKEEKKRGISIDLGFTSFNINSNKTAGIIDVPGHEKFLKNMLAGIAGMDLILLVVSAEEGIMPQTQEHLDILNLIGIKKGIVVITKADKVDKDIMEIVKEDVVEEIRDSFLRDAPVIEVDSITKKGIKELIDLIDKMTEEFEEKNIDAPARLFVDRVFSIKGFGSVITGTLVEGKLNVDDQIFIYPGKLPGRIRGLQVHSKNTKEAYAGQRVAVNLSNISVDQVKRGDILYSDNSLPVSMMIDTKLNILNSSSKDLEHWDRIKIYHGAREILGRAVPLNSQNISKGDSGFVQIRLEEEISAKENDHIIIRLYSPMETIGGGIIIDPDALKHTSNTKNIIQSLELKEEGSLSDKIESIMLGLNQLISLENIKYKLNKNKLEIDEAINELIQKNILININEQYIHNNKIVYLKENMASILENYHVKFPYRLGMLKEELRNKISFDIKPKEFELLLQIVLNEQKIKIQDQYVFNNGFSVIYEGKAKEIKNELEKLYIGNEMPLQTEKIINNNKLTEEILNSLLGSALIKISDEIIYDKNVLNNFQKLVLDFLDNNSNISVKDFKEISGLSRKYMIGIMEYFDRIKLTKRSGDSRVRY